LAQNNATEGRRLVLQQNVSVPNTVYQDLILPVITQQTYIAVK